MKHYHELVSRRQKTRGNNNQVVKEQSQYKHLRERYGEMNEFLLDLIDDHKRTEEELRYLNEFIHYKNLEEEFRYFSENAHE